MVSLKDGIPIRNSTIFRLNFSTLNSAGIILANKFRRINDKTYKFFWLKLILLNDVIYLFILSFLDNDFNLIMVASTTETSFNKISFNQKNFHVLSFIYRLKLKKFENLNGIKNSFKLTKFRRNLLKDGMFRKRPKKRNFFFSMFF